MASDLTDEEIVAAVENGAITPDKLLVVVQAADVEPTGSVADDIRAVATEMDIDVESLLYALTSEDSPLYNPDPWD